jgi:hypothetical protein
MWGSIARKGCKYLQHYVSHYTYLHDFSITLRQVKHLARRADAHVIGLAAAQVALFAFCRSLSKSRCFGSVNTAPVDHGILQA